jgi:hypothetical protein
VPTVAFRVAESVWLELERRAVALPHPLGSRPPTVHDVARDLVLRALAGEQRQSS